MTNEFVVTCFADMKDSTPKNETMGNIGVSPIRDEYLAVGEILAKYNGGDYIKNIGGNDMITFRDLESQFCRTITAVLSASPKLFQSSRYLKNWALFGGG